jgi:hypothetical protein
MKEVEKLGRWMEVGSGNAEGGMRKGERLKVKGRRNEKNRRTAQDEKGRRCDVGKLRSYEAGVVGLENW